MKLLEFFQFKVAPIFRPFLENVVYKARHGVCKGLMRKGGLGFIPQVFQLSEEEKLLMSLDLTGKTVYDVGAASGLYTIFFARQVGENGRVVAFEPNPVLCRKTIENVELNLFTNVTVLQVAVGKECHTETLAFPSKIPGVGSLAPTERTRILSLEGAETVEVTVDSLDNQINRRHLPKPDFVKIDVQGLELGVLKGMQETMRNHKPGILVEVHAIPYPTWVEENLLRVVKFLIAQGYSVQHVESKTLIDLTNSYVVKPDDHLHCVEKRKINI